MKQLCIALLLVVSSFAQTEIMQLKHGAGPTQSGLPQAFFYLPGSQFALGASTFAQFSLSRVDSPNAVSMGNGSTVAVVTAITGSGSSQSINVSYTGDMAAGSYWLVDPGLATQEVVLFGAPTDITHVGCVCQNSHIVGSLLLRIYSQFTKFLFPGMIAVPPIAGLSHFNFIRYGALPSNVYDQYLISGSYGTLTYVEDDVLPWINGSSSTPSVGSIPLIVPQYDPAVVSATGNPTNGIVLETANFTTSGSAYPQVRVQFLVTTQPETPFTVQYRGWWDTP
jgi:hypothetical protein